MDSRNPYIKTFITKHNIILKDKIVYSDFYNNRNIEKPFTLTSENVRNDIGKIDFENVYSENNGRSKDVENYEMPQGQMIAFNYDIVIPANIGYNNTINIGGAASKNLLWIKSRKQSNRHRYESQ